MTRVLQQAATRIGENLNTGNIVATDSRCKTFVVASLGAQGEAHNTFAFEAWSTVEDVWREQFAYALSLKGISFGRKRKPRKRNPVPPWQRPIPPAKTWGEAFERTIPGRPFCADDFELGVYPCRREYALIFRYIQYNRPTLYRWLIVCIS